MRAGGLLLALLLASPLPAASERWPIAAAELPPALGAQLPDQGYYAVMLRRVLQEIGVEPELQFLPGQRALVEAAAGRHVVALPFARTAEREREFLYSEPLFTVRLRAFTRAGDTLPLPDLAALAGQTLCSALNSRFGGRLQREIDAGRVRVETAPSTEACFRMLDLGRVRLVVTGEHTGWALMRKLGPERFEQKPVLLDEQHAHLLFPRRLVDSAQRLQRFDAALRRLRAQGVMHRLERERVPAH